jgi:Zn-dependent peptidase ImmA (M78 family)
MASRGSWNPWRVLRQAGDDVIYQQVDLPSGDAWWVPRRRVVLMRPGLEQVERRCALAHELGHRELGHSGQCHYADSDRQGGRAEEQADAWASRKLITVAALASVLVWTDDPDEAAAELWVTRRMLDARLKWMHLGERIRVRQAVERREDDHRGGGLGADDGDGVLELGGEQPA